MKKLLFLVLSLIIYNTTSAQNIQYIINGGFDNADVTWGPGLWGGPGTIPPLVKMGKMPNWDIDWCVPWDATNQFNGTGKINTADVISTDATSYHNLPPNDINGQPVLVASGSTPEGAIGMYGQMASASNELTNVETANNDLTAALPQGEYNFSMYLVQIDHPLITNDWNNNWHIEAWLQNIAEVDNCDYSNERRIFSHIGEIGIWFTSPANFCVSAAEANFYDRLSLRMVWHGSTPSSLETKYFVVDNVSLEQVRHNPPYTVDDITCLGYGKYQVHVSGDFNGAISNWQVYSDNTIFYDPGTEQIHNRLTGVTGNSAVITIDGHPGDFVTIRHGTYNTCTPWREHVKVIQIPCMTNTLDPSFTLNVNCNDNDYTVSMQGTGHDNPCDTYWQYNLVDAVTGDILEIVGYFGNNDGDYDNDTYSFNPANLKPCHDYIVHRGVWSECVNWTASSQTFTTTECVPLTPSFQLQDSPTGPEKETFVLCNDFYFNGTASTGEYNYYVDLWKLNGGSWQWIAKKGATGWTPGKAGIFNVKNEFTGVTWTTGTYKMKLAVGNNCNGWVATEKVFNIVASQGPPQISAGTVGSAMYGTSLYQQHIFYVLEDIWIESPIPTALANNYDVYVIDFYEGLGVPSTLQHVGEIGWTQGMFSLINVKQQITWDPGYVKFSSGNWYTGHIRVYNDCGVYADDIVEFYISPTFVFGGGGKSQTSETSDKGGVADLDVTVFPNPSNGLTTIDLGETREAIFIKVMDNSGRIVQSLSGDHVNQIEIDLTDEAAGIYLIEVQADNQRYFEKLIKQ